MSKDEIVDKLLNFFIKESGKVLENILSYPYLQKRRILRGVINMRPPKYIPDDILKLEDNLLQLELNDENITDVKDIITIEDKISVWLGDITTLKIDAIVNACNSSLLGCFIPNHSCIDNQIHSKAGIRLRLKCNELMNGKEELVGKARITSGYNLPCKFVIHTVGPTVYNKLTNEEVENLKKCYVSCLDIARENRIRTIAFPCISTGVFHFPKDRASQIAVHTVKEYLKKYPDVFDKIVFNVFTGEDKEYYDKLF